MANLLFVCTGNAARSVMAVTMMRHLTSKSEIRGAGTFSISGLPMSKEEYSTIEKSPDRKAAFKKLYETNTKAALFLVHEFHTQIKGKKVKDQPLIDSSTQVAKKSADFDCTKLNFNDIEKKHKIEFKVTSQKSKTTCTLETSDGFLFQSEKVYDSVDDWTFYRSSHTHHN